MVIPGNDLGNSQVSVNRTIGPTLVHCVVILGHNLGNSQVSVYRTIGPTLFFFPSDSCQYNTGVQLCFFVLSFLD